MYLYLGEWNPRLWGIAEVHDPVYSTASGLIFKTNRSSQVFLALTTGHVTTGATQEKATCMTLCCGTALGLGGLGTTSPSVEARSNLPTRMDGA
eukprot:1178314-Prorocentrum_minimum.AAC.4